MVNKIRWTICRHFRIKKLKVGHAGTLDPLATGLLILCTGKMTKRIEEYQGMPKTYTGSLMLGGTTPSFDQETDVDRTFPTDHVTDNLIQDTVKTFLGETEQIPPLYSAVKQEGKRLYKLAREGKETVIKPRKVHIESFSITKTQGNELHFEVTCSKGTYIRSLVHDFGKALGSGAYLTSLRRVAIGQYHVDNARTVEEFISELKAPDTRNQES